MAAATLVVGSSLPIAQQQVQQQQQQQQAQVEQNSVLIRDTTAQVARRIFAAYAVIGFAMAIAFTAVVLTVGAGWHLIATVPLVLFLARFGVGCLECRTAENINYENKTNLSLYRHFAKKQDFLTLQKGHGLDNVIKHKIVLPEQLREKFDEHVRNYASLYIWPNDCNIFDIPALVRAGFITEQVGAQLKDIRDQHAQIRATRSAENPQDEAVMRLKARYKALFNI